MEGIDSLTLQANPRGVFTNISQIAYYLAHPDDYSTNLLGMTAEHFGQIRFRSVSNQFDPQEIDGPIQPITYVVGGQTQADCAMYGFISLYDQETLADLETRFRVNNADYVSKYTAVLSFRNNSREPSRYFSLGHLNLGGGLAQFVFGQSFLTVESTGSFGFAKTVAGSLVRYFNKAGLIVKVDDQELVLENIQANRLLVPMMARSLMIEDLPRYVLN